MKNAVNCVMGIVALLFINLFAAPAHSLVGEYYLSPDKVLPNLCMIRNARGVYVSCVIVDSRTLLTASHNLADEAGSEDGQVRMKIFTQLPQPHASLLVEVTPNFFDKSAVTVLELNRDDVVSGKDIAMIRLPESMALPVQEVPIAGVTSAHSRDDILYAMSQKDRCQFHGVGKRLGSSAQMIVKPEAHSIYAPVVNAMSLKNPMQIYGLNTFIMPGDSGGAYTCVMPDGQVALVGLLVGGNNTAEETQQTIEKVQGMTQVVLFTGEPVTGETSSDLISWLLQGIYVD